RTLNPPNAATSRRGRPEEPQPVQLTGGSLKRIDPDELRRALEAMPDLHTPHTGKRNGDAGGHGVGLTSRNEIIARLPGWVNDLVVTEDGKVGGNRSSRSLRTM